MADFLTDLLNTLAPAVRDFDKQDAVGLAEVAGGAGLIAGGVYSGNPAMIGGGLSLGGQGLQTLDTQSVMQGLTDQQIATQENAARRAGMSEIRADRKNAQRVLASGAASRGVMSSSAFGNDMSALNASGYRAGENLEAQLARTSNASRQARRYTPQVGAIGAFGRLASTTARPFIAVGAKDLAMQHAAQPGPANNYNLGPQSAYADRAGGPAVIPSAPPGYNLDGSPQMVPGMAERTAIPGWREWLQE